MPSRGTGGPGQVMDALKQTAGPASGKDTEVLNCSQALRKKISSSLLAFVHLSLCGCGPRSASRLCFITLQVPVGSTMALSEVLGSPLSRLVASGRYFIYHYAKVFLL